MIAKEFYSQLGKLLFAVANADGLISAPERKALHELVRSELASREKTKDAFGTNTAYYTEIEFDYLEDSEADAETSLFSFIDFIRNHKTAFDPELEKLCLHVVEKLASAYYGINKQENKLIEELKDLLKHKP